MFLYFRVMNSIQWDFSELRNLISVFSEQYGAFTLSSILCLMVISKNHIACLLGETNTHSLCH